MLVRQIIERAGFVGLRGQRPTSAPPGSVDSVAPALRLSPTRDRPAASAADPEPRRLLESELFLAHGLDDVAVREVLG